MKYINMFPILNNVLEITTENRTWDLRNDIDFIELSYNVLEKVVLLTLEYPSEWLKKEKKKGDDQIFLQLKFESVTFIEFNTKEEPQVILRRDFLEGIHDFYERKDGTFIDDDYITFIFSSDSILVVRAESLKLDIKNEK